MQNIYQIKTKDFKKLNKKAEELYYILCVILVFCQSKLDKTEEECIIPVVKHALNQAEILYLTMFDIENGEDEYKDIL